MTEPTSAVPAAPPADPLRRPLVLRLILCAGLFALWILYLALLVLTRTEVPTGPRLLSRPQAWTSTFDIVARIEDPTRPEVVVEQVLYPPEKESRKGEKLVVSNLASAGSFRGGQFTPDVTVPGTYLLLLQAREGNQADLVPLPPSPGFSRENINPRVYAATADLLAQYARIVKPTR